MTAGIVKRLPPSMVPSALVANASVQGVRTTGKHPYIPRLRSGHGNATDLSRRLYGVIPVPPPGHFFVASSYLEREIAGMAKEEGTSKAAKVKPMSDEEFRRRVEALDAERKVLDIEVNRRLKEASD